MILEERSENTSQKYMRDIKAFILFLSGAVLTKEIVIEYKKRLQEDYAVRSVNSMLAIINSLFDFLVGLAIANLSWLKYCWKNIDIEKYEWIKSKADKVVYTSEHYYNGCMQKRNRHLVDQSGLCICYYTGQKGGTEYTVDYARKKEIKMIRL